MTILYFLCVIIISFYIPGSLLLKKLNIPKIYKWILSIGLGIIMWGWQGFLFGSLNIRMMSYVYLMLTTITWVILKIKTKKITYEKIHVDFPSLLIILVGTAVQMTTLFMNGTMMKNKDIYFCCGDSGDNIYFAAVSNQIVENYPPKEPGVWGLNVKNYHYWSNIIVGDIVRVFHLPLFSVQFQYMPLLISLLLGLSILAFAYSISLPKKASRWILFFFYFGGDLIWLVLLLRGNFDIFTMSSLEDGARFLANTPRAYSISLFLINLTLLTYWIKTKSFYVGIIACIALGSLTGFKVYTGITAFIGLFFLGLWLSLHKQYKHIIPIFIGLLAALIIYLPVNAQAGGLYFSGGWIAQNFITQPPLKLIRWEMAKIIFEKDGKWLRVIQYMLMFIGLFTFSIFGTKLIGFFQNKKYWGKFPVYIHLFIIPGLILNYLFGIFTLQGTGSSNTFNFLANVFIIGSIYAGLGAYSITNSKKRWLNIILTGIIILLTIPRSINVVNDNIHLLVKREGSVISHDFVKAGEYIKKSTNVSDNILVYPSGSLEKESITTGFSLFSNRQTFFTGNNIYTGHSINGEIQKLDIHLIFKSENDATIAALLIKNNISYIVFDPLETAYASYSACFSKKVYSNDTITIHKVYKPDETCIKNRLEYLSTSFLQ